MLETNPCYLFISLTRKESSVHCQKVITQNQRAALISPSTSSTWSSLFCSWLYDNIVWPSAFPNLQIKMSHWFSQKYMVEELPWLSSGEQEQNPLQSPCLQKFCHSIYYTVSCTTTRLTVTSFPFPNGTEILRQWALCFSSNLIKFW